MLKFKKIIISSLIVASVLALNPMGVSAEWKQDSKGWRYLDNSSYVTGWRSISGNWYYFYSNGYMATCDKIDGYFVNSNGVWTNSITAEEARQLILNEDGDYVSEHTYKYGGLSTKYSEISFENMPWSIPKEPGYTFGVGLLEDGEASCVDCTYFVGKNSKNVYILPGQSMEPAYQIENNQKVKIFKWLAGGDFNESYQWR